MKDFRPRDTRVQEEDIAGAAQPLSTPEPSSEGAREVRTVTMDKFGTNHPQQMVDGRSKNMDFRPRTDAAPVLEDEEGGPSPKDESALASASLQSIDAHQEPVMESEVESAVVNASSRLQEQIAAAGTASGKPKEEETLQQTS